MARLARREVRLTVQVDLAVTAEFASGEELSALLADPKVTTALSRIAAEKLSIRAESADPIGWLDDDRPAHIDDLLSAITLRVETR